MILQHIKAFTIGFMDGIESIGCLLLTQPWVALLALGLVLFAVWAL